MTPLTRLTLLLAATLCCSTPAISQDQENKEIATVRQRLKVMRHAVNAFLETGNKEAAALVERAMHARELAIEGKRGEEAQAVRRRAPNRAQLAEYLGAAANLYKAWRKPDRAEELADLSEVYAKQWRRVQQAQREGRTEEREGQDPRREGQERRGRGLDNLERRVQFLEIARKAYDEAGRERHERSLAATVRYGRLALGDASDEAIAKAAEGVPSMGNLIELLQGAHNILAEKGQMERAMACHQLAEFYAKRERERRAEGEGERERAQERERERDRRRSGNLENRENRIEILRLAKAAHRESGNERNTELMERILHLAELQLEGTNEEAIAKASEGLTQGTIIELVAAAAGLYSEWKAPDRADMCVRLVSYYQQRADGNAGGEQRRQEGEERREGRERDSGPETERKRLVRQLQERVGRMQEELQEIQQMLRRLMK